MKLDNIKQLIDWMKDILLEFEGFFHDVQGWLEGTIIPSEWFGNLLDSAAESTTAKK